MLKLVTAFFASAVVGVAAADAQTPESGAPAAQGTGATICGLPVPPPRALPPENSGPVVYFVAPCFDKQGNTYMVDPQTYLYYIHLKPSQPSQGIWTPYDDAAVKTIVEDHRRLWATGFLDDLSIEAADYVFPNGVIGKLVTYHLEERQRVKVFDFVGSKKVDRAKIDEKLREANITLRIDTFMDPGLVRRIEGIVRDMLKEKGYQFAEVTHQITEVAGGPKLINLTFNMSEGPKVKIRSINFTGNQAISDGKLRGRMKDNKPQWFLSFITGRGTYIENKYAEDADRVLQYYLDRGYINAQVGNPELKFVGDSPDKKTRWVEITIPVREGNRYRVGNFDFAGNTVVKTEVLRPLFKLKTGDYYSQDKIRKGFQKAQELYGAGGYMEFTGYPEPRPRDQPNPAEPETPAALAAVDDVPGKPAGPPTVDVTMRIQEGKQYFVNRITFVGNTTTRDSVIRREMRLYENGVFDSEALKYSIRRLNQLGYFKALEGPPKDVFVDKTVNSDGKVDVRMQLEEQNRNQLTFGAGVSQFEGFFGQLSFQTANFLGRGESLTVALQAGSRAQQYTLSFTEPFLFDRNITGGINLFKNEIRYIGQFTQKSAGGALTFGFPLGRGFTRMFTNYSYEQVRVSEISDFYNNPDILNRNPFFRDSLLIGSNGARTISQITPSIVHNTVDQPIFPTTGRRLSASIDLAGFGGNTRFWKPMLEGVWFLRQNARMTLGMRGQFEYIRAFSNSLELPIFEKLFQGGEYTIRGFDIRTVGPTDCDPGEVLYFDPAAAIEGQATCSGIVLGGNKSLLFNVEQSFHIAGPVRLILFYDAGQVQAGPERQADGSVKPAGKFSFTDFKTSTGAEVRFFMPVLNVPFRLIFAYNPQREGVLDNNFRPQKAFQFRFAVGTTF
jgi:outer membrane protein insertion porin family